jgi:hypothetical protein
MAMPVLAMTNGRWIVSALARLSIVLVLLAALHCPVLYVMMATLPPATTSGRPTAIVLVR